MENGIELLSESQGYLDRLIVGDARDMREVPDGTVDLIVTSPPYNCRKPYATHDDAMPLEEYVRFLVDTWKECWRVLKDGGRIAINVNQMERQPTVPLPAMVTMQMLDLGFQMRGLIVWEKGMSEGNSTAWGSWMKPTNPILRDNYEFILVFNKGPFKIPKQDIEHDITKEEFLEWSRSMWHMNGAPAKKIGHPAPFPVDLPLRLMKFYTYPGAVVLDPFMGSGSTALAAKRSGRHFIGYDISEEYVELAYRRLENDK